LLLTAAGFVATALQCQAAFLANSTGILSPVSTVTFSEVGLATDTPVTNHFAAFGVTFSPNLLYNPQPFAAPNQSQPQLGNYSQTSGTPANTVFLINFTSTQTDAAFSMITNPGASGFEALLAGVVVDSGSAPTDFTSASNFFGFTGVTFDAIRVTPATDNNAALIDNIQLGTDAPPSVATPLPATALLAVFGGLAFGSRVRRRNA